MSAPHSSLRTRGGLGDYLTDLRMKAGMSQTDLAMALRAKGPADMKWSQATVSQIETGKRSLRAVEVAALADILEVPAADLLARVTAE